MLKKIIFIVVFFLLIFFNAYADSSNVNTKEGIISNDYTINVSNFTPWWKNLELKWNTTEERVNFLLWTIIQKLMIALGTLSLFVMTIWAGYMIFYHWQDELLSKWKSIFISWLIALSVALSSYYIVSLVRYILYST